MFGYIKPFKPYMRFCEYDIYSAFYCGLCKNLGREYGHFFRLMLSYDFAFLGILSGAYSSETMTITRKRCVLHPLKKRLCLCGCASLEYASGAAVISVYHKICDSIVDSKGLLSVFFRVLRLAASGGYKKAASKYPELAETVEIQMNEQFRLERERCKSVDGICEPTAKIMSAMAEGLSENPEQKKQLSCFGYHLGRFVYIADAFEDMEKDAKKDRYNPFLLNNADNESAEESILASINLTLGMIAEYYSQMSVIRFKEIIDNVVYLGLKNFRLSNKKYLKKMSGKNKSINI